MKAGQQLTLVLAPVCWGALCLGVDGDAKALRKRRPAIGQVFMKLCAGQHGRGVSLSPLDAFIILITSVTMNRWFN